MFCVQFEECLHIVGGGGELKVGLLLYCGDGKAGVAVFQRGNSTELVKMLRAEKRLARTSFAVLPVS